jgi:hypothetical protein
VACHGRPLQEEEEEEEEEEEDSVCAPPQLEQNLNTHLQKEMDSPFAVAKCENIAIPKFKG